LVGFVCPSSYEPSRNVSASALKSFDFRYGISQSVEEIASTGKRMTDLLASLSDLLAYRPEDVLVLVLPFVKTSR